MSKVDVTFAFSLFRPAITLIRYSPPKSQVWGHQVGRLSATMIVDRSLQFLNEYCTVITAQPSELMIGWNPAHHAVVSPIAAEIDVALGQPTTVNNLPNLTGDVFCQRRWPYSAEMVPTVASWFDKLSDSLKTKDVVAQSSIMRVFAWRDEPPPLQPMQSAGGMFGIHFGRPHRITTMFTFRDLDQYSRIKVVMADLGLADFSDKHVRPKPASNAATRRAK